jgi:hypothetical protein
MSGIKRAAIVFAVLSLLLFADGAYLQATNDQVGGDSGLLFGNGNMTLSPGTIVLISAALVLVGAVGLWAVGMRRDRRPGGRSPLAGPGTRLPQPQVGTGHVGVRKEGGDQH